MCQSDYIIPNNKLPTPFSVNTTYPGEFQYAMEQEGLVCRFALTDASGQNQLVYGVVIEESENFLVIEEVWRNVDLVNDRTLKNFDPSMTYFVYTGETIQFPKRRIARVSSNANRDAVVMVEDLIKID